MTARRFGWVDLYRGLRFLAPVSEESLLEAGRAAGLREGATLLELSCGSGSAAVFLAETFHLYARGIDSVSELLEVARERAERSPARTRLRFYHEDAGHPDAAHGPVDALCRLAAGEPSRELVRAGGQLLLGRYVYDGKPEDVADAYPLGGAPAARPLWVRVATPLEWERYLRPMERALLAYRATLRTGDPVSPVALAGDRRIHLFRTHSARLRYELSVYAA